MPMQLDALTSRAFPFAARIDHYSWINLDVHEGLSGRLGLLVHAFQLERVEPDAAAAPLAGVYHQAPHLNLRKFIKTRRTFHILSRLILHTKRPKIQPGTHFWRGGLR